MMRRAFTLIELLVVIAIIAILAAILFPVFAQAKTAAKKSVAISNQKQIGTAVLLYLGDYDDQYPRRRGCELNSSINTALNDGTLRCGGTAGFGHSMTWQTWQKYLRPYTKSVEIFFHPSRQRDATEWSRNGQILNGFAINLALFGANVTGFTTTPWTGGTQSGIANPSSSFIIAEMPNTYGTPFATPNTNGGRDPEGQTLQTAYPMAFREYWRALLNKAATGTCAATNEPDPVGSGPSGGLTLAMADGSAKFMSSSQFLAQTPTIQEYLPSITISTIAGTFNNNCRRATSAFPYPNANVPNLNINYPLWNLGQ